MQAQRQSRGKVAAALVVATILGTMLGAVVAGILSDEPGISERATQAWSQRLEQQAVATQQARMWNAWTLRLTGPSRERADRAYTERLNGPADELGLRGMSDRAAQVWTDRLNGLAEEYLANR